MFLSNSFSLLLCLFDGHGAEGEQVVNFCCSFTSRYFKTKSDMILVIDIQSNPEIFLSDLVELCDNSLRNGSSKINSEYSGT
jgi:serine/threonine protein phosphatase PrpC